MTRENGPDVVLVAEDDPEDCQFIQEAFSDGHARSSLRFVGDGERLLDYLYKRGEYSEPLAAPQPSIVLLDLNMPRKDGREALREIKADPKLRRIPVVVLTTSKEEEDILRSYDLGANSYVTKPVTFSALAESLKTLGNYWLETVQLPPR
jgi:CheY-like chemotaxis protein